LLRHVLSRCLAGIGNILFVREPHDEDIRSLGRLAHFVQALDRHGGNIPGHRIVKLRARQGSPVPGTRLPSLSGQDRRDRWKQWYPCEII